MLNKIIFDFIFLFILIFIGVTTSYEDFKNSKIRNKWIMTGLISAFMIYFISWIIYILVENKVASPLFGEIVFYLVWNFDKWCINLLISTIIAYLLWYFKMWAAGDAKLFITYSALIPMGQYSKIYFNYNFSSFSLLLNIFIPATVFIFLKSIFYFIKKFNFIEVKKKIAGLIKEKNFRFNRNNLCKLIFGFFIFFLFFRILRYEFDNLMNRFLPNQNILMLISLLVFNPLSKIFKKKKEVLIVIFVILLVYIMVKTEFSGKQYLLLIGSTLIRGLSVVVLFPFVKKFMDIYTERSVRKTTPFAIWMFIGALITWFI